MSPDGCVMVPDAISLVAAAHFRCVLRKRGGNDPAAAAAWGPAIELAGSHKILLEFY
jgi:hypothetical protein